MLIQDQALRELFKTESDEHLQRLDDVLLRLEQAPAEHTLIEEAFREAHSMKGAARMLGLKSILALSNRLETSLNSARQGTVALERESITKMLQEVGSLRVLVKEATGDTPMPPTPESPSPPPLQATATSAPTRVTPPNTPENSTSTGTTFGTAGGKIESVRVDTRKLDELMIQAGELVVTHTRVSRRLSEMDELIQKLDNAVRSLPEAYDTQFGTLMNEQSDLRAGYAEDTARLEALSIALESNVRQIRLLPFSQVFKPFPRMVRDLAQEQGKDIDLRIDGEDTLADKRILEEIKDPLMHMLRNAIDHGIESAEQRLASGKPRTGILTIRASHAAGRVVIQVSDDGKGLDPTSICSTALRRGLADEVTLAAMSIDQLHALILLPGFSTKSFVTDISGRGVGMDVVRANIERLKGTIEIDSEPGRGTRFTLRVPNSLATLRVLMVISGGLQFGLPTDSVGVSRLVSEASIFTREGRNVVLYRGVPVPVAHLASLLGLPDAPSPDNPQAASPCVFMTVGKESFGVFVDALVDEQLLVLKPRNPLLDGVRNVLGAGILTSGEICTVLDPGGLLSTIPSGTVTQPSVRKHDSGDRRKKLILLAEDSITTRAQEVRILEGAGYEVVAATDGLDAFGKLGTRHFDAVVSDINMPRLDGLQLAEKIRAIPEYADLPVILVTSLSSDEDKRRGLEIGANAYITKPEFDQSILLECLERLVG